MAWASRNGDNCFKMGGTDKIVMDTLKQYWFLGAAIPIVALAYFAITSASPENVCDLRRHLDKQDYRFCLLAGGTVKDCLE